MPTNRDDNVRPTILIQVLCLIALVALSGIDAFAPDFAVNNLVYAIIAGILFGVGNIKNIFGGGK